MVLMMKKNINRIIRNLAGGSKCLLTTADNRSQTTVHGPLLTQLNFKPDFLRLLVNKQFVRKMQLCLVAGFLLLVSFPIFSQQNILRYADQEFALKRYEFAGSQYEQAFAERESYYAARRAAECYGMIRSYEKAFYWWGKAVAFEESSRTDSLRYTNAGVQAGQTAAGLGMTLTATEAVKVFGQRQVSDNPRLRFIPIEKYNSVGTDYGLRTDETGTNYLVTDRGLEKEMEKKYLRFDIKRAFSEKEIDGLNDRGYHLILVEKDGELKPAIQESDEFFHVSMPAFFKVGASQEVIFTGVLREKVDKFRLGKTTESYPGLYRAEVRADGTFANIQALPFNETGAYSVMHAFVDNNVLYFSSDGQGGFGGFDIYQVPILENGYGSVFNLGAYVNGAQDEVFPFVKDGIVYFSSNRFDGLGGLDIYKAGQLGKGLPMNLGKEYNTPQDDFGYFMDGQGNQFLSSDRGMSESRDDIYAGKYLYDYFTFRILGKDSTLLDGDRGLVVELKNLSGEKISLEKVRDGFVAELSQGEYFLEVSREGYLPARVPLLTTDPDGTAKIKDISLEPIPVVAENETVWSSTPVLFAEDQVYFDLDAYDIRKDGKKILDQAVELLKKYPFLKLQIDSDTDSRGSTKYNERLSKNRSMEVFFYLKNQGIAAGRMEVAWHEESRIANRCGDGEACSDAQHQANRRSVLTLLIHEEDIAKLPTGLNRKKLSFQKLLEK
jgi:outer membrane protein OmpA-like peptidoglycan-associated protein/tetratricopeptide (TPR) repeat protein